MVKICVVKRDPSVTAHEIIEHCRKYLTGYKVPKIVEFRDELPKTNVGKILRRELREELMQNVQKPTPQTLKINKNSFSSSAIIIE